MRGVIFLLNRLVRIKHTKQLEAASPIFWPIQIEAASEFGADSSRFEIGEIWKELEKTKKMSPI
jgi:hypothetical protein